MASRAALIVLATCAAIGSLEACTKAAAEAGADAAAPSMDGGGAMTPGADACPATGPDCYPTPLPADASSLMILNACTDAQAFDPTPKLPLLGPCGKLPALP